MEKSVPQLMQEIRQMQAEQQSLRSHIIDLARLMASMHTAQRIDHIEAELEEFRRCGTLATETETHSNDGDAGQADIGPIHYYDNEPAPLYCGKP